MSKFYIDVIRTSYAKRTLVIEAANGEEAYDISLNTCGDYDYNEYSSDYEIDSCQEEFHG